ncbi:MAG: hypothetical protein Q7R77_00195 [Candidatus Daviesbacteria bacterium]|nr:hypothetical protein [Candidatus Daviesbacteria bacterium]
MDKFLNFYSKYPWVAIIIVFQWLATAFIILFSTEADILKVMGTAFLSTVIFAYIGFKAPKA